MARVTRSRSRSRSRSRAFALSLALSCLALSSLASCKKRGIAPGEFIGNGNEQASVDTGTSVSQYSSVPANDHVTIRGSGASLRLHYGTCDLAAVPNPDGWSAKIPETTCVVGNAGGMGSVGTVALHGTFHTDPDGNTLSVLIVGGGPIPGGKNNYTYSFTGTRAAAR